MSKVNDDYLIPFGKYRGKRIGDVPADYLIWFIEQEWSNKWPDLEAYVLKNEKQLLKEARDEDARSEAGLPFKWR
jgi:uncharacterized protein (DUF3820 family)